MKATSIPWTTDPTSVFVLADVNGVIRLRQALPSNVGAVGPTGPTGPAGPGGTGPAGATGATGAAGAAGAAGADGSVWRDGAGVPANGLGANGDYYLNTSNGDVYLKAAGTYSVVDNLTGPTGATGATGPAGTSTHSTLTYAATTNIDFDLADYRSLALTGNVTFTTSNRAAPKTVTIKILADASIRTFTFPAWIFVGAAAPASIAANKTAILTVTCFGTADTDIVAAYSAQP